jgi:hypothetical protein
LETSALSKSGAKKQGPDGDRATHLVDGSMVDVVFERILVEVSTVVCSHLEIMLVDGDRIGIAIESSCSAMPSPLTKEAKLKESVLVTHGSAVAVFYVVGQQNEGEPREPPSSSEQKRWRWDNDTKYGSYNNED